MKTKRVILQELDCKCQSECDDGRPTPYPLEYLNEIGEHCHKQRVGKDKYGTCRFLYWRDVQEIDTSQIDISEKGYL